MDRARAARGAVIAGLATVAISTWFATLDPVACGGVAVSPVSALSAFQSAKSQPALDIAIGCQERLAVLNSMNRVDLLAYIASYGLLIGLAALALADGRLRRVALMFLAVGLVGDVVETATQLWIGARWPFTTTTMLLLLAVGNAAKWAGIAWSLGAIGLAAARGRSGATRWLGVAVAVFGLLGLAVFVTPVPPPFLVLAILLLIGACALNARRDLLPDTRTTASR